MFVPGSELSVSNGAGGCRITDFERYPVDGEAIRIHAMAKTITDATRTSTLVERSPRLGFGEDLRQAASRGR